MKVAKFEGIQIIVDEPYNENDYMEKFNTSEMLEFTSLVYSPTNKEYSDKKMYNKKGEKRFIFLKHSEIIGSADLYNIEEHTATIRFWISKDYWGEGIATKAVKEICNYCFNKMKLKRVDAYVFKHNLGSINVLEKSGFHREGLLKYFDKKADKLIDEYICAIYNE